MAVDVTCRHPYWGTVYLSKLPMKPRVKQMFETWLIFWSSVACCPFLSALVLNLGLISLTPTFLRDRCRCIWSTLPENLSIQKTARIHRECCPERKSATVNSICQMIVWSWLMVPGNFAYLHTVFSGVEKGSLTCWRLRTTVLNEMNHLFFHVNYISFFHCV